MNNKHKYFRNLRYKQKLEKRYEENSYSGICFFTKEVDTRYKREYKNSRWYREEKEKEKGHNYYLYFDRPEVKYTIHEDEDSSYTKRKQYYKRYSNKKVRKTKDIPNHKQYRKIFDLVWEID